MDWSMPADVQRLLKDIDVFIEAEIKPLQREPEQLLDGRREQRRVLPQPGLSLSRSQQVACGAAERKSLVGP
jgi:hypothetical protein